MPEETPAPARDLSKLLAFRTEDLPEILPLSLSYIKELIRTGDIKSIKIGGARIIPRWAVEEFLETPAELRQDRSGPPGGAPSAGDKGQPGRQ